MHSYIKKTVSSSMYKVTENREKTEKIHISRPESDDSDDDDMEEIRRTVSHKPDIHIELDDKLESHTSIPLILHTKASY